MSKKRDTGFYYWLAGLIDGEGWFTLGKGNSKSHGGSSYHPVFGLKLRADDAYTLEYARFKTCIGRLYSYRGKTYGGRHNNPHITWKVSNIEDCYTLIQILDEYPLRSKKQLAYQVWREVVLDKYKHRGLGNGGSIASGLMQNKEMHEMSYLRLADLHKYHVQGTLN